MALQNNRKRETPAVNIALPKLGQDIGTSAVVCYQQQFQLDVSNWAFRFYLQLLNHFWASVVSGTFFKYPNNAKPQSLAVIFDDHETIQKFIQ
ncbi:MAG: hypothetical protein H0W64_12680 [Gammaproteobacteria bacterium]|nr:hypothetical protein [Gammaproteobacteria bacterium]